MSCIGVVERLMKQYPCCELCDPDFCRLYVQKKCRGNKKMNKSERYRFYWLGKSPRVRKATEDYFRQPLKATESWKVIASRHQISVVALRNNVKRLRYLLKQGYLELPHGGGE